MYKLYIAVLDTVPSYMVPTLVAHSVLGAHLTFNNKSNEYDAWLKDSFKKVVLKVNAKEFAKIAYIQNIYLGYEKKTLGGINTCIVLAPREDYPNVIKFAKMWKPE